MVRAVIFDWYGTLARWEHGAVSNYQTVFADHGFVIDEALVERYHMQWDGIDHAAHSVDRESYLRWTRGRLEGLARECGVPTEVIGGLVDALVSSDYGAPMVVFPEVHTVLAELRRRGFAIGVCSNWGWDLEPFLEHTGVAPLVDVPVTSAQAGYRKPHPAIYATTLAAIGVTPTETVFVGDSWAPDVLGPISAGMTSVHIWREPARTPPALVAGASRVETLEQLLSMRALAAAR